MVTIPEGLALKHIAKRLEDRGFGPQEQFLSLSTSPQFLAKWDLQEHGLEGYLYPDTYFFSKQSSAADILGRMVIRPVRSLHPGHATAGPGVRILPA